MMNGYSYNIGISFSDVARANAGRVALKYPGGSTVTFSQLEALSNKIAHFLQAKGLKKNEVVAIFNNKSPEAYAAMLACLKTGIIYTNLDPNSPYQRIKKIIERCKPSIILHDIILPDVAAHIVSELGIDLIETGPSFVTAVEAYAADLPAAVNDITGSDPAYIMFTSGSTGFPKGAVITHGNLLNFIEWGRTTFNVASDDIFTNANPIYFDNSVFDFYVSLFSGAQLVPLTADITKDPFTLIREVEAAHCNTWFSVPSLLVYLLTTKALSASKLPGMKRFIFGGEGFPKPKLKKLYELFNGQATLYNVYGPTECTCICSSYVISEKDFEDMNVLAPLGFLAPNFSYVLLDHGEVSANKGELCLKGPNVGAGYYNDADRTAGAFIQNPANNNYNEIVYRTGDLVEVDMNGHLHFKGRADNQVKHMGYRIELEEIESVLNTLDHVDEAAVIYEKLGDGLGQIISFVSSPVITDEASIMMQLKNMLPDYMLPKKMFIMTELPKNQNGKIDRVALKEKRKAL
jgi:D-alanine--poly(phosphoribitol) ligase subunit 1